MKIRIGGRKEEREKRQTETAGAKMERDDQARIVRDGVVSGKILLLKLCSSIICRSVSKCTVDGLIMLDDIDDDNIDIDLRQLKKGGVVIVSTETTPERDREEESKKGEDRKTEAWSLQVPNLRTGDVLFLDLCITITL